MRTQLKDGRQTLNRSQWNLLSALVVASPGLSACGEGEDAFNTSRMPAVSTGMLSGSGSSSSPYTGTGTSSSDTGTGTGSNSGSATSLAGTWSGSVTSLGRSITRTTTFAADSSPLFVCDDGTQASLTRVGQSFQCRDSFLSDVPDSDASDRLTLEVSRLVREQTRVEFDLQVLVPASIRIDTRIDGPTTTSTLSHTILYRYSFVRSGNQLSYTLTNEAGDPIERGALTKL